MTQHQLFPTARICAYLISIEDLTTTELRDGIVILIRQTYTDGMVRTVYLSEWTGVMVDLLSTLQTDVAAAFLYGKAGDIARAAIGVEKVAKRHSKMYDRA